MTFVSVSQFHVYLPWGQRLLSFQPGEGPSRGFLRDCKTSRNLRQPSFAALGHTHLTTDGTAAAARADGAEAGAGAPPPPPRHAARRRHVAAARHAAAATCACNYTCPTCLMGSALTCAGPRHRGPETPRPRQPPAG